MISVSFLKSKLNKLDTIKKIDKSDANYIHVDLMDGIYVENSNIINYLDGLENTIKPLDVHLMVDEPIKYIEDLAKLNTEIITFHLDSCDSPLEVINKIKEYNIKVGIAINPSDDINIINDYIDLIDYVLIMSVVPGRGGQEFIKDVLIKLDYLKNKYLLVGIDGGINSETVRYLKNYDIDIIVSGSYICMSDNYNEQINILRSLLK